MYKDRYDEMGLGRNMLSRTMEDSGTLWSPLVPWSSCGAYHTATLGVPTLQYAPFCFMNIVNPILALVTVATAATSSMPTAPAPPSSAACARATALPARRLRPTRRPWPLWLGSG